MAILATAFLIGFGVLNLYLYHGVTEDWHRVSSARLAEFKRLSRKLALEVEALSRMVARNGLKSEEVHRELIKAAIYAGTAPQNLNQIGGFPLSPANWYAKGDKLLNEVRRALGIYC